MAQTHVNTTHLTKGQRFKRFIVKAIGEVLLLVIGILIALKINNLNNDYQLRQKIRATYTQVENELKESIANADQLLAYYKEEREVTDAFMKGQYSLEDYANPENRILQSLGLNFKKMVINTNGFDKLKNYSEGFTSKELKKYGKLQELYIDKKGIIDQLNDQIAAHVFDVIDRLSANQPWFANYIHNGDYSKETIQYFATNQQNKNDIALYSLLTHKNHFRLIEDFKVHAEKCLKDLKGMKR